MADAQDIPAWIALFMGVYALAASIGELVRPGSWEKMLSDFRDDSGLRFLTGIVLIALGAAIYLVSPWRPDDWLAILVTVMGGGMVAEGAIFLAFGEPFIRAAKVMMGWANRGWALFSAVMGIALIAVALTRL
ncbi:MAG: hypothetical protein P8J20_12320 [Novosphingobium sp.]|nr:hypothetical protein [Novosphingobium sp.]